MKTKPYIKMVCCSSSHISIMAFQSALVFVLAAAVSAVPIEESLKDHVISAGNSSPKDDTNLGIYHGKRTTITQHPYTASLLMNGIPKCAGAILSDQWVLTSADCGGLVPASDMKVVVGSTDGISGETFSVAKVVMNPHKNNFDYDVACILISGKFTFSDSVKPTNISTSSVKPGSVLETAAYGSTHATDVSESNHVIMEGEMNKTSEKVCKDIFGSFFSLTPRMACAYNKDGTTLCPGDWGAVMMNNNEAYGIFIAGMSGGICSSEAEPILFASIPSFEDWIKETIGAKYDYE